jgi:protein-disulfide isomerase
MKAKSAIGAIALVLALAACNGDGAGGNAAASDAPISPVAAPQGGDWTQMVAETPEGGFRMGNPNATVKLVEYASYSCPHCAEFSETASAELQNEYVKSGRVSWEFRPFLLFPTDPGVTMLVRCHGAQASFLLTEQLYAQQREWMGRLQNLPDAQLQAIQALPPPQRPPALVQASGLDQFFRQRGMPEAKITSCLANPQALNREVEVTERGSKEFGVQGTPTFFINGKKLENTAAWAALEPAIRQALR